MIFGTFVGGKKRLRQSVDELLNMIFTVFIIIHVLSEYLFREKASAAEYKLVFYLVCILFLYFSQCCVLFWGKGCFKEVLGMF